MALTITTTQGVTSSPGVHAQVRFNIPDLYPYQSITFEGFVYTSGAGGDTWAGAVTNFIAAYNAWGNGTWDAYSTDAGWVTLQKKSAGVASLAASDFVLDGGYSVGGFSYLQQGTTDIAGVTETTDIGFVDLLAGEKLTIGGLTATATANVSASAVAAAFANINSNTTGNVTAGLTFSDSFGVGFTSGAFTNSTHVLFTATTANTDVVDLFVNYAPVTTPTVSNGIEDTVIPVNLVASDKDGAISLFRMSADPANGSLYADSALTQPFAVGTDIPATQIPSYTTAQIAALTSYQIAELTTTDIAAMSATQAAVLMPGQVIGLTTAQISVMQPASVAALTTASLVGMLDAQLDVLSPDQVTALEATHAATVNSFSQARKDLLHNAWSPITLPPETPTTKAYFKPNADWNGTTNFSYAAVDNQSVESAVVQSTINVAPVPDAPTISSPHYLNNIVITQGTATTSESVVVTFSPLNKGDSFTLGGVTATVLNPITADNVAYAFANGLSSADIVLSGSLGAGYTEGSRTGNVVTFTNGNLGNVPDVTLFGTGFSVSEAPTISSTGSFTISDVDFPSDSVTVDLNSVTVSNSPSGNAAPLATSLNSNTQQVLNFLTLTPAASLTATTSGNLTGSTGNVVWNFDIANIPAFASLLTGESVTLSYNIEAADSNLASTPQTLNFTVNGVTKIISAVVTTAEADVPAAIQIETESGTNIKLFDGTLDVTDKFNAVETVDASNIKTVVFTVKTGIGYNGNKTFVAKSYLTSNPATVQDTWTGGVLSLNIPDGADLIMGTTNNDTITGSGGSDTLQGFAGDDVYYISDALNVIQENVGEGNDTVHSTVTYTLPAAAEVENFYLDGTANINATGNPFSNNIYGNPGNNTLDDGDANGSTTSNNLSGGKGDDIYIVHSSQTSVNGETNIGGVDTVRTYTNFFALPKNVENLELNTFGTGKGNNLANIITGSTGADTLDGGAGADMLTGGAGGDTYIIDRATDVVVEQANEGTDTVQSIVTITTLFANVENLELKGLATISGKGNDLPNVIMGNNAANTLEGELGDDSLNGASGNDLLIGGAGSDNLVGGIGVDTLTGGADADIFIFPYLEDMGVGSRRDVITDFVSGTDKIDLPAGVTTALGEHSDASPQPFTASGQIRWSFYGTGASAYAIVQGNTDTTLNTVEFEIKLNGVTALVAGVSGDFILA